MNMEVIYCVIILLLLCFTGATGSGLWLGGFSDTVPFFPYSYNSLNPPLEGFITFWTFVIILQVRSSTDGTSVRLGAFVTG